MALPDNDNGGDMADDDLDWPDDDTPAFRFHDGAYLCRILDDGTASLIHRPEYVLVRRTDFDKLTAQLAHNWGGLIRAAARQLVANALHVSADSA